MDESKTLDLKDITSLKLLQDMLFISISSLMQEAVQAKLYELKPEAIWQHYPFSAKFYRNLCCYMNKRLEPHP
jgi:hypothetical protein